MLPDCNLEYKETNRDLLVANYNNYWARITTKNQIVGSSGIQGDKTITTITGPELLQRTK